MKTAPAEPQSVCLNVYEGLGFENPADMQAKADLIIDIQSIMKERGHTQMAIQKLTGIPQARVSGMLKGDFDEITIEGIVATT